MKLKVKRLKFFSGRPVCMIHQDTIKKLGLHLGDRVSIKNKQGKEIVSIINAVTEILRPEEIALSEEIFRILSVKDKEIVKVKFDERPHVISVIKKKLDGHILSKKEIYEIVENIADNSLTEVEVAFFIIAVSEKGMNLRETKNLIQAMVDSGNKMDLKGKIVDKHSIGGVAGNRTTPIVVSICAASGLTMPKTSSRAITSAAGTADTVETIAKVDFPIEDIKKIIKKTKACLIWGGALGLAPVDDKIIRVEKIMDIDSPSQLTASILSKKISVGSKYIVIDIPYGKSAKVTKREAEKLKKKFEKLDDKFYLKLKILLTDGSEPIGRGVGPLLEMKDVLKVLKRKNSPEDLEEKSILIASELLELSGKVKKGKGIEKAKELLNSEKAYKKFLEIIKAQKGDIDKIDKIIPRFSYNIKTKKTAKIKHLSNKLINRLARILGSPDDKAAGIYIYKKKNETAKKGEKILTLYSVSKEKMTYAKNFYTKNKKKIIEFY
ncbi:thymidine phosphorylase [Candidatus Pacearchaeota archaeon]|nr:thymidine phosphorylase [Candidatus Pacearchaeota archaeon]MBD3282918.1 thymidine phosphorylase [Candidatus Pacearchaeota archaeon]